MNVSCSASGSTATARSSHARWSIFSSSGETRRPDHRSVIWLPARRNWPAWLVIESPGRSPSHVEERRRRRPDTLAKLDRVRDNWGRDGLGPHLGHAGKLNEKVRAGDRNAKKQLSRVRDRQKSLESRKREALESHRREPDLIHAETIQYLSHALVLPSDDPEDQKQFDAQVEAIAMKVAISHEEAAGAVVRDVSKPNLARAAGLTDNPGFDFLSQHSVHGQKGIEVKGRAGIGDVELTENEWAKACNERERYWLYVVFDCGRRIQAAPGTRPLW